MNQATAEQLSPAEAYEEARVAAVTAIQAEADKVQAEITELKRRQASLTREAAELRKAWKHKAADEIERLQKREALQIRDLENELIAIEKRAERARMGDTPELRAHLHHERHQRETATLDGLRQSREALHAAITDELREKIQATKRITKGYGVEQMILQAFGLELPEK